LDEGWASGWWALDEVDPSLRELTVGVGPGLKLPLLNETLRRTDPDSAWTVVSDDDVAFRKGDVVRFVRLCERADLDLAQPARARGTHLSHGITAEVRRSRARRTSFVESGPLFAVGPRCRDRILPLPGERGMGWGVEIDWYDLTRDGCRLGILDAVVMEHLGETASDYDDTEIRRVMLQELVAHGHPRWAGMRNTLEVWRPWQRRAPWREGVP
jgi:hypothetical protein